MAKNFRSSRVVLVPTSQVVFEEGILRQVIVEAEEGFAILHLKGLRRKVAVPWGAVYHLAAAHAAKQELRARKAQMDL